MSKMRPKAWLALALIGALALMVVGGIFSKRDHAVSASDTTVVRVGSDLTAPPGGSATVAVEILGAAEPGVGAVTVDVVYDPAVVEAAAWAAGPGWDSVLCNLQPTPNSVRCTAVNVTGAPGDSSVASITLKAVGEAGQCSTLEAQVVTLADPAGNAMPAAIQGGQVCISAGPSPATMTPAPPGSEPPPTPTLTPPPGTSPPAEAPAAGGVSSLQLVHGCNPVVSTWPDEIDPIVVVSSTAPTSAVTAIWKFDQERAVWLGFSPTAPASVSDAVRIQLLDVLFVCVDRGALLTRPEA